MLLCSISQFLKSPGVRTFRPFVCLLVSTVCLSSCCKKDIYIVWYYQPWQELSLRTFHGTTFRRCHSRSRTHLHCNFHHSYHRGFHCVHRHPPRNSVRQVLGCFSPAHHWISTIETYQVNRGSEALKSLLTTPNALRRHDSNMSS